LPLRSEAAESATIVASRGRNVRKGAGGLCSLAGKKG
jgi:hypothetical protein